MSEPDQSTDSPRMGRLAAALMALPPRDDDLPAPAAAEPARRIARGGPRPPRKAAAAATPSTAGGSGEVPAGAGSAAAVPRVVGMYVDLSVRDALNDASERLGLTHDQIITLAVAQTRDVAGSWFPAAPPGLVSTPRRRRVRHGETQVPIGPRLLPGEVAAIDALAAAAGAQNRSVYVNQCLRVHLGL